MRAYPLVDYVVFNVKSASYVGFNEKCANSGKAGQQTSIGYSEGNPRIEYHH